MKAVAIDICVIEDDATQRTLLVEQLRRAGYEVMGVSDAHEGLEALRTHHPSVVICDVLLPDQDGIEITQRIRRDHAQDGTYLMLVTACSDRKLRQRGLDAGADDYLNKPYHVEELIARVRNGMRISKLQDRLRRAALTDGLTGLWNHAQFRDLLDREFARTRRYGGGLALLMLDIDHFKAVNDTYGHETGNVVLQALSRHLRRMVRDIDVVARYGGEEFAIICPETTPADAAHLAERIRATLPERVTAPQVTRSITASIGVAASTEPGVGSVRDLIDRADAALYASKHAGRNCVTRSDEIPATLSPVGVEIDEVHRLQKQVVSLSMQAKDLCLQSVWALVQALEARDRYTAWHSRNTTFYTLRLAAAAGWPDNLREAVGNAAMLHDLGKIGVPDQILQSARPLTESEAMVLRQVPLLTCKILEPLRVFETETLIIRHLRERFDGAGYPFGLSGNTIPIGSRLLAVAETVDALTSERPHRGRLSLEEAVDTIADEAGHQFDPQFCDLLAKVVKDQRSEWQTHIARSLTELPQPLGAPTASQLP